MVFVKRNKKIKKKLGFAIFVLVTGRIGINIVYLINKDW